jgi:hypothetical protein
MGSHAPGRRVGDTRAAGEPSHDQAGAGLAGGAGGWLLGLVGFPALLMAGQWLRARRTPTLLRATGPVAHALNVAVFLVLYLPGADQRRRPAVLWGLDVAGGGTRVCRLRGAGRLQLAAAP